MAEQEVWRAFHEGLPVAVINPSLILGAGNWIKGSVNIVDTIHKGVSFFPVGSTGIVDVRDVAKMAGLLLESSISGERFICNGGNISYRDLFSKIAGNLQVQPPAKPLKPWLEALAWRVEAFKNRMIKKPLTVTRETLMTSSKSYTYDASKAKNMLNFEFRDPDSILLDCCNAYQEAKKENRCFGVYK